MNHRLACTVALGLCAMRGGCAPDTRPRAGRVRFSPHGRWVAQAESKEDLVLRRLDLSPQAIGPG